jgi:hypothetical protein
MSVRSRPARARAGTPEISLRALVMCALAAVAGVLAWLTPMIAVPMTVALATFVVLDHLTST